MTSRLPATAVAVVFTLLLFVLNLFVGSVHLPPSDVCDALLGRGGDTASFIVVQHRLPMALTALAAGTGLSVAGLLLQTAFHNPLAGPSVLGISGGAALGVAVVVLGTVGLPLAVQASAAVVAAFVGAMAVTALLVVLSAMVRSKLVLLIAGMLLGYLVSAVITILSTVATPEGVQNYVVWGMGDFSGLTLQQAPWFCGLMAVLVGCSFLLIKPLNLLLLGDLYARNLGVAMHRLRGVLLILVGAITALATAACGPVAFIGLVVPHVARMVMRTDNFSRLLPATALFGAATALLCNVLCSLPNGVLLPLNAVTPVVGVPVIIYVVVKRREVAN